MILFSGKKTAVRVSCLVGHNLGYDIKIILFAKWRIFALLIFNEAREKHASS